MGLRSASSAIINAIVNAIIKAIIIDIMEEFDYIFCTKIVTFRQEALLCGGCVTGPRMDRQ